MGGKGVKAKHCWALSANFLYSKVQNLPNQVRNLKSDGSSTFASKHQAFQIKKGYSNKFHLLKNVISTKLSKKNESFITITNKVNIVSNSLKVN